MLSTTQAELYSKKKVKYLKEKLDSSLSDDNILVVTSGSFAREEANEFSDLDFFIVVDGKSTDFHSDPIKKKVRSIIKDSDIKMPSSKGAFAEVIDKESMLKNIGGFADKTENLTRRMLFLLECKPLYNEPMYNSLLDSLLCNYVKDEITEHQLCRFLLNDLIRYYRTICVDFEFKTSESGKSWGDRNIKLMFSRKLIYFSGILSIAQTVQQTAETKRQLLRAYFTKTPIERIRAICGSNAETALREYDLFLKSMATEDIRKMLQGVTIDRSTHSPPFRDFKNRGHHFSMALSLLLNETFDTSHPIHHAIKF